MRFPPPATVLLPLLLAACGPAIDRMPSLTAPPALPAAAPPRQPAPYGAQSLVLSQFVAANHATLVQEITAGGGARLSQAMNIAGVPLARQPGLIVALRRDLGLYLGDPQALTRALLAA